MKLKIAILSLLACALSPGQSTQSIYYYSGSNLQYACTALSFQPQDATVTVSAASNANPVSFTATSHGFDYQSGATVLPIVKITGGTGNWAAVNGVWVATPTGTNTFTIAVDSTAFGALTGTLVVTTRSPRTTDATWAVKKFVYDGSSNLIWGGYGVAAAGAGTTPVVGPSPVMNQICANRAALSYQ